MCSRSQLEKGVCSTYTFISVHGNKCLFMWGLYSGMGAYRDVIKMGAYIYGVLIVYGCSWELKPQYF